MHPGDFSFLASFRLASAYLTQGTREVPPFVSEYLVGQSIVDAEAEGKSNEENPSWQNPLNQEENTRSPETTDLV